MPLRAQSIVYFLLFVFSVQSSLLAQSRNQSKGQNKLAPITTRAELEATTPTSPNPYVSFLPVGAKPDYRYWNAKLRFAAEDRPAQRRPHTTISEGRGGSNNTVATAQAVPACATSAGCLITGNSDVPAVPSGSTPEAAEPNDTIATATVVAVGNNAAVTFTGNISNDSDFDVFALALTAGDSITIDLTTPSPTGALDPIVAVFADPEFIAAFNEDDPFDPGLNFDSFLQFTAYETNTFYVVIGGFRNPLGGPVNPKFPSDLNIAGSGPSGGSAGIYEVDFSRNSGIDYFAVPLTAGDVIGAASDVNVELSIISPTVPGFLDEGQGSNSAFPGLLPSTSPLPTTATGNEVSNVARTTGTHYVRVRTATTAMAYELIVNVNTPPSATLPVPSGLYLDFDGATGLDAMALFGIGSSNATLSPLSSFLAGWGLAPGDQNALIDAIVASLVETVSDLLLVNPSLALAIIDSRTTAVAPPNFSTLIIGGTRAELGIGTIGIASTIDTGNFGLEDTGVILLDLLSLSDTMDPEFPNSLNQFDYVPATTAGKIALVAEGVANITIHEAGHFWGSWHTEQWNQVATIQDRGGNLANTVGVGPDGDFGTPDDVDVDFVFDIFSFEENLYWGFEDQPGRMAFGLEWGQIFSDGFESGNTTAW